MANAGMDIKNLQYVMGHSDAGVTLNVYTHASYDRAGEQMAKILEFKENDTQRKMKKAPKCLNYMTVELLTFDCIKA